MQQLIKKRLKNTYDLINMTRNSGRIINKIKLISEDILTALNNGNKLLLAGNGGSCSDAFHIAGEFVSKFKFDRNSLPAIALGSNNSILTAIGNDYGYEKVFSRELSSLGNKGDVFVAISTSGNSENILEAVITAKQIGLKCYGLTGRNGGKLKDICKCIRVPSNETPRIQEVHIMIGHIICEIVESKYFEI